MPAIHASTALSRLRIIDLTRVRAGPTCVKQFADFGADVIKVEMPPGDGPAEDMAGAREGYDMQNLHRNKRSMTLNLKLAAGREVLHKLVETADVVVENYRPEVKHRLGLDYETLRAINRRIILASISGFGQDGPYRDRPGMDQIAQGMSGLMSVTGFADQGPVRTGAAITDVTAGLLAALGIMTALLEREVSGEGQWVQSSLLLAGIALMDFQAARYLIAGEVPERAGNDHPYNAPTSAYKAADGYINVASTGTAIWMRLCNALVRPELAQRAEFATAKDRASNRAALNAELNAIFATRTSEQWFAILNEAGVPCGPIYTVDQMFADPQVQHVQAAASVKHPQLGEIKLVNQPVKLSRTPAAVISPTPGLGAHTAEVLHEAGYSDADIAALREKQVL